MKLTLTLLTVLLMVPLAVLRAAQSLCRHTTIERFEPEKLATSVGPIKGLK